MPRLRPRADGRIAGTAAGTVAGRDATAGMNVARLVLPGQDGTTSSPLEKLVPAHDSINTYRLSMMTPMMHTVSIDTSR